MSMVELGSELQAVRKLRGLTLQAASEPANISIAYLQKLESGVVHSPSPRVLERLARVLDVPYLRLMELAGYLPRDQAHASQASAVGAALAGETLTEAEWRAVAAFVQFLKMQRGAT